MVQRSLINSITNTSYRSRILSKHDLEIEEMLRKWQMTNFLSKMTQDYEQNQQNQQIINVFLTEVSILERNISNEV